MAEAVAQFHMRRAEADREGYYVTRWDRATPMTVLAPDQPAAVSKATAFSGPAKTGKYWTFIVDRIEEMPTSDTKESE